jgi:sodium-dependent dicarboxylate transporter 2/3/5
MAIFFFTSFFWIFQEAINTYLLHKNILNDTNIAMVGGMLMFLIPVDLTEKKFLLDWKDSKDIQWGILLLFGGGLCLADALKRAEIIQLVGNMIAEESTFNVWLILILITASVILSEFMSNVALVQIFVPVVFGIADGLNVNPILLALPVTLSASIGFMFPVATPPNAIVFSSGYIRIKDMVKAGFLLDVLSIAIILLASVTLMVWIFGQQL